MKIKKYKANEERLILTAMIVNDHILGRIHNKLPDRNKPFESKWCNIVAGWCFSHFEKYKVAPRQTIQQLFEDFASETPDEKTSDVLSKFLGTLSEDYKATSKELNPDYVVDLASRYFERVALKRLGESILSDLDRKKVENARERVDGYRKIDLSTSSTFNFDDEEEIRELFEQQEEEVLIRYPKGLGAFFGNHLKRDSLFAFMGPEKRGKTWWLVDMAWRGMLNRRKVLYYTVGDLSKNQIKARFVQRISKRPWDGPKTLQFPKRIKGNSKGGFRVESEPREYKNPMSFSVAKRSLKQMRTKTKSSHHLLKINSAPADSVNVEDIENDVHRLSLEEWIPDVILIDYADVLAPEPGTKNQDFRHRINTTWMHLRRLSQRWHCLVGTATQSDAASYDAGVLQKKHFSEDKRKAAHVNMMVGINQTEDEKENGIYRLNTLFLREGYHSINHCVGVASCLDIGNPAVLSKF